MVCALGLRESVEPKNPNGKDTFHTCRGLSYLHRNYKLFSLLSIAGGTYLFLAFTLN